MQEPPLECRVRPVSYEQNLATRHPETIDLAVIHCTELPDLPMARDYAERIHYPDSGTGNCGHFYVDRDGSIEEWAHPLRIAHHVRAYNQRSIGVELVNTGRYPDWLDSRRQIMEEPYPDEQLAVLNLLLLELKSALPSMRWIAGHQALDTTRVPSTDQPAVEVSRKLDPGPLFPWPDLLATCGLELYE